MSYKVDIARKLSKFTVTSPDNSNVGGYLADVYLWANVADLAIKKRDEAWKALVTEKMIKPDDWYRENIEGETIPVKTSHFQALYKLSNPRAIFDRDAFIEKVSQTFKVSKPKLIELAAKCVSESRAPLSKRVLEI